MYRFIALGLAILPIFSCAKTSTLRENAVEEIHTDEQSDFALNLQNILADAHLPENINTRIMEAAASDPSFFNGLFTILRTDPYLWILVDKEHPIDDYAPQDLVELVDSSYRVSRSGLMLRAAAASSLQEMAEAARGEGLTLTASSAYRSYSYQVEVYARNVREMGQAAADRVSARPGYSQHQLGLVADFGSITDAFAQTREGIWLAANASRFGWSLSFPDGYEDVTGYRWESWHYRYVGRELALFIDSYFDSIQQYALTFIHEYVKGGD